MSASRHVRSLLQAEAVYDGALGSVRRLTGDSFPILNRLSMKRLLMKPAAIREAHWHANANELACCLSGTVLITIVDNADVVSVFTLTPGQMFYVDSGSLHSIENVGEEDAELIIAFTHERPEDFSLHGAFGAMSDAVLGNTYDLPAEAFAGLPRDTSSAYLVERQGPPTSPRPPPSSIRTASTSRPKRPRSTFPTVRPACRAPSSGRRSKISRCTRSASPTRACASPTGTRTRPRWATSTKAMRG